jgi:hypothetical protein
LHYKILGRDSEEAQLIGLASSVKGLFKGLFNHDFLVLIDIEALVRQYWMGVPVVCEPVKVSYPIDGISNFNYITDTMRVSLVYARLCIGLIFHAPVLIFRKIKKHLGAAKK